ncbi:MAG: YdcH family protein [Porticoccaceae bacterium]|nr:YdcH family protein [Porticoccaceae bacterium]
MFPEFRDLITKLKHKDRHFDRLLNKHNELDQKIIDMEARIDPNEELKIEQLKKEKLQLKDELYLLLRRADTAEQS